MLSRERIARKVAMRVGFSVYFFTKYKKGTKKTFVPFLPFGANLLLSHALHNNHSNVVGTVIALHGLQDTLADIIC